MWEQSTLWESVEKWVTKYLKKSHSEYRELQVKAMRIVEENPTLRTLINSMEGIVLTPRNQGDRKSGFFIVPLACWISKNLTFAVAVTFIFSAFTLLLLANHACVLDPSTIAITYTIR